MDNFKVRFAKLHTALYVNSLIILILKANTTVDIWRCRRQPCFKIIKDLYDRLGAIDSENRGATTVCKRVNKSSVLRIFNKEKLYLFRLAPVQIFLMVILQEDQNFER